MFTFLNSTILLAASAAIIPLLIHLFSRRRRKVVEFSSLRHLKAMQRRQVRRLKIRQLLLLIIRTLIILAVVIAFARPTLKDGNVGKHASVSAVIIFDNTASMNRTVADGQLFELARRRTASLLETFGQGDKICLLPLTGTNESERAQFVSLVLALEQLKQIKPGESGTSIDNALGEAINLLEDEHDLNREIYIVCDQQRRLLPEKQLFAEVDAKIYLVELPVEEVENIGVTSIDFGGQLIQAGHDFEIVVSIKNYGAENETDRIASCFLDGRRVSQNDFEVGADREVLVRFTTRVTSAGFHSGFIELSDDKFLTDNREYFSFYIPEQFNVLVIENNNAGQFMTLALAPSSETNKYWSVKNAKPEELFGLNFYDYDLILLAGTPRLSNTMINRLNNFIRIGNSAYFTYDGNTDINYFNEKYSSLTGITYQSAVNKSPTRAGFYTWQSIDLSHPIFSVFDLEDDKPPEVKFWALPRMSADSDTRIILEFTGGQPALVEKNYGDGKVITFTGPMSPKFTDLVSHGFFVPMTARISEYLASDLSGFELKLFTDQNINRPLKLPGAITEPVQMTIPDSARYDIIPDDQNGTMILSARPTNLSGIYHIEYKGQEIDRFAVNVSEEETNLASVDADQFLLSLGGEQSKILEPNVVLAAAIAEFRIGRELWHIFAWLAALLLMAEMLLGRRQSAKE